MSLRNALATLFATLVFLVMVVPMASAEASQASPAERQVVNMINQSRNNSGVSALELDAALTKAAQEQAKQLANNYARDYGTLNNLMRSGDYKNVSASVLRGSNVEYGVKMQLARNGNAALSSQYKLVGVGIADCKLFGKVCVQVFAGGQSAPSGPQAEPQPQPQQPKAEQQPQPQPQQPKTEQQPQPQPQPQAQQGTMGDFQKRVVELVNRERANNGLSPLVAKSDLNRVAQVKAEDMAGNRYFSHTSPTYGSPFDMMRQFGINYTRAGENIAMGYRTPESVMEGWMNSPGHRANILNPHFTEIGVGFAGNGNYWVQLFARR
ncbi:CAP domain-containing protein [Desulfofalx alkaliphila]|uniref:CAP domain-containing protein n=1 Tax=Desulfofalx alkaliphila TaxID=105483 RepID=UPI0004E166BE|nr:CAP domain-containing protein [Desulfofalx alkaliphila]